jgi:hypothetical protein
MVDQTANAHRLATVATFYILLMVANMKLFTVDAFSAVGFQQSISLSAQASPS